MLWGQPGACHVLVIYSVSTMLGTHTMRKTGAYLVYTQSNYNISLVMHLLNHLSEYMTLTYLGLNQDSRKTMLDQIDFG